MSGWVEVDRDRVAALYVLPSCGSRGVGSVLLARAETSIRSSGYAIARLESSQNALDFITTQKATDPDQKGKATTGAKGPGRPKRNLEDSETSEVKRRKEVAQGRFGSSAKPDDGTGIDRFEVRIDDPFPGMTAAATDEAADTADAQARSNRRGRPSLLDRSAADLEEIQERDIWVPDVRVTFQGSHIFAGIRQLVEQGVVDGEKMPGWMTGEAGVTVGAVKNGRIRTKNQGTGV